MSLGRLPLGLGSLNKIPCHIKLSCHALLNLVRQRKMGVSTKEQKSATAEVLMATPCV